MGLVTKKTMNSSFDRYFLVAVCLKVSEICSEESVLIHKIKIYNKKVTLTGLTLFIL